MLSIGTLNRALRDVRPDAHEPAASQTLAVAEPLPVQIFLWSDSPERAFTEKTAAAILVLLVFLIAMNLIAILLRIYSERTPAEILATKPDFVAAIGLDEHLSPTRNNGLSAMLTRIFAEAKAASTAA